MTHQETSRLRAEVRDIESLLPGADSATRAELKAHLKRVLAALEARDAALRPVPEASRRSAVRLARERARDEALEDMFDNMPV